MLDPEHFKHGVTSWLEANPALADQARSQFNDPAWLDQLVVAVYPCPPSGRIKEIIRAVALEILGCARPEVRADAACRAMESRIDGRLRLTEAIYNAQFTARDVERELEDAAFVRARSAEAPGDGISLINFESRPLGQAGDSLAGTVWYKLEDFERDFPDAFEDMSAAVRRAVDKVRHKGAWESPAKMAVAVHQPYLHKDLFADLARARIAFGGAWAENNSVRAIINVQYPLVDIPDVAPLRPTTKYTKLQMGEAVQEAVGDPQFAAVDMEGRLAAARVDADGRNATAEIHFKSRKLAPEDVFGAQEWSTLAEFELDFPGAFDFLVASVKDEAERRGNVDLTVDGEPSGFVADPRHGEVKFGNAWLSEAENCAFVSLKFVMPVSLRE